MTLANSAEAAVSREGGEDRGRDFIALGLRARPLSDAERREMGASAPEHGWKIINSTGRRTSLRTGDVIVGACEGGASLQAVMTRLRDSEIPPCLVVLRNGESIHAGPAEAGPTP
jgi:hypothetical protein